MAGLEHNSYFKEVLRKDKIMYVSISKPSGYVRIYLREGENLPKRFFVKLRTVDNQCFNGETNKAYSLQELSDECNLVVTSEDEHYIYLDNAQKPKSFVFYINNKLYSIPITQVDKAKKIISNAIVERDNIFGPNGTILTWAYNGGLHYEYRDNKGNQRIVSNLSVLETAFKYILRI